MAGIPLLTHTWLAAAGIDPVAGEPRSDCAHCPQTASGAFHPQVKCCGTWPTLPNYLVGSGLHAGGAAAASLRARMADPVATSPAGLGVPPERAAARLAGDRQGGFGSDPDLACPHLEAGRCAIWAHRDAVCTTWFCRLDRGAVGQAFWLALRAWMQCLEQTLSRGAMAALDTSPTRWGRWSGDREGFYVAAFTWVSALPWEEVRRLGGFELRTRTRDLREAHHERLHPRRVEGPFEVGPYEVLADGVRSWSPWDRLPLDEATLALLEQPDALGQDVVRALVDHRVLLPLSERCGSPR